MIKTLFMFSFLAVFGTYGLGLAGVLDDPDGHAIFDLEKLEQSKASANGQKQNPSKPDNHYTLKAMR